MVRINLIPKEVQFAAARKRRLMCWSAAVCLSLLVLSAPLGYDWIQRARAAGLRREESGLQARLVDLRGKVQVLVGETDRVRLQLERAEALRSKRAWSLLIALIGESLPRGCWLTEISTDPPTPRGGAVSPARRLKTAKDKNAPANIEIDAPRKLLLAGYASDAAEPQALIASLKGTGVFSDVFLKRSRQERVLNGTYFRFELMCEW